MEITIEFLQQEVQGLVNKSNEHYELFLKNSGAAEVLKLIADKMIAEKEVENSAEAPEDKGEDTNAKSKQEN